MPALFTPSPKEEGMPLTDTQLVILSKASQRQDRAVELPPNLKGAPAQKVVTKLLKEGLVEEVRARGSLPAWRRDEEERPFALRITKRGMGAIEVDEDGPEESEGEGGSVAKGGTRRPSTKWPSTVAEPKSGTQGAPRQGGSPRSKQDIILEMLRRPSGATVSAIMQATGWQPHSVRGFFAGVVRTKLRLTLVSDKPGGERIYRIGVASEAGESARPRPPKMASTFADPSREASDRSNASDPAESVATRLRAEIEQLQALDVAGLRQRWRKLCRAPTPEHLPPWLLRRIIAYRIQAAALGDLDRETIRFLEKVATDREQRRASGERSLRKKPPPVPPVSNGRSFKPGSILVREHANMLHQVTVMSNGFAWNGTSYRSLSEVAFAITGTNWNGPRFFGLRESAKAVRLAGGDGAAP